MFQGSKFSIGVLFMALVMIVDCCRPGWLSLWQIFPKEVCQKKVVGVKLLTIIIEPSPPPAVNVCFSFSQTRFTSQERHIIC